MCRVLFIIWIFLILYPVIICNDENEAKDNHSPTKNHTRVFHRAGVVTNSEICTNIALDILEDDGSAVDAAIAALLCEGLMNPQSMGIGGGFLMTIFDASTQETHVLNAREVAPAEAKADMFKNCTDCNSTFSGLAVAVPGELMGYWEAHQRFGKIGWYDLFRPAIDLAFGGFHISRHTSQMMEKLLSDKEISPTLLPILKHPETDTHYKPGDIMRRKSLADTLETVAQFGPMALYNGCLTHDFVHDVRRHGGVLTAQDLSDYKAIWQKPIEHSLGNYILYSAGKPGSGEVLMYILDVMSQKICDTNEQFWHYFIETWKFAFGIRASLSGGPMCEDRPKETYDSKLVEYILHTLSNKCMSKDPNDYMNQNTHTQPEDHGTSHICIYTANGDAVSVTSTINLPFGAQFMSESTGIILNNEMVDFSLEAHGRSSANKIIPKHYPMSSMVPTIVVNAEGKVRLVIGGSGGFKILTAVSLVTLQNLYMGVPLRKAIRTKRLHQQLIPLVVEHEADFDDGMLNQLQKLGHTIRTQYGPDSVNSSSSLGVNSCVNGISIKGERIFPVGDLRRNAFGSGI